MTTQTELFPRTTLELLEELAEVHRAEHDKAAKALDALSDDEKIARAYEKAEDRLAKARHLVAAINQAAERERKRLTTKGPDVSRRVMQEAADILNSGAVDTHGLTVTASVSPAVDPITGEVMSGPVADWRCPVCRGLGQLPDKTGGGHHRCKHCKGTGDTDPSCGGELDPITGEVAMAEVFALYPGDDNPHATPVGDRTRYGELVADYSVAAGLDDVDAKDWSVVAEDELTTTGGARKLRDVIEAGDYGKRLLVVAADQGSVTGVEEGSGDE